MEEIQERSKQRRVYSDSNAHIYASFSRIYMRYLLPALLNAKEKHKPITTNIEKIVRFEVDMALASSTDKFKWSRALKRKLEQGGENATENKPDTDSHFSVSFFCTATPKIPRPLVIVNSSRPRIRVSTRRGSRSKMSFGCRVRILQRIVPGGSDMGLGELLSEVQSYVFCLQLQVKILRSLVDAH